MADLFEILDYFDKSNMNELEVELPDLKLKCSKGCGNAPQAPVVSNTVVAASEEVTLVNEETEKASGKTVKAPLVGTFYTSSSPDNPPFVQIGDKVHKGQVIGIIEAMKVMNEIESEYDGEVAEILVGNNDVVEYDQPLFIIK